MQQRFFLIFPLLISLSLSVPRTLAQGEPPVAPSNLQATAISSTEIYLTWVDNSSDETAFVVEENGLWVAQANAGETSLIIGNLAPNSSHCYVVNAYNGFGDSDWSNEACATVTPPMQLPAAPSNLRATVVNDTQIRLDWIDNSSNETGFHIIEAVSIIDTVGSNITTTIIGNLEPNEHCFLVTAYNEVGDSYPTNMACATIVNTSSNISGWVRGENGIPLSNVVISSSNGEMTSTRNNGSYTFSDQKPGTYTITPSKSGWIFVPSNLTVSVPPDATGVNFTAVPIQNPTSTSSRTPTMASSPTRTFTPPILFTTTLTQKPASSTPTRSATPSQTSTWFATNSPSRTPSQTPTKTATRTPFDTPIAITPAPGTIEVNVTDGYNHPLVGVEVLLLEDIDGISTVISDPTSTEPTITDQMGYYKFTNIPFNEVGYRIGIRLQTKIGQDYRRRILWGSSGLLVNLRTEPFQIRPAETTSIYVDFGKPDSVESDPIPKDKLDDLAAIYHHLTEVEDFVKQDLGESNFLAVRSVWAYAPQNIVESEGAFYCTSKYMDCMPETIYIGQGISDYELSKNNFYRPMNREWHESFHYVMDFFELWPFQPGLKGNPHDGIRNDTSYGSWTEGWAEFFPTVMLASKHFSDAEGYPDSPIYRLGSETGINLEVNWESWGHNAPYFQVLREDIAVAALLWDFYDPKKEDDRNPDTIVPSPFASLTDPWDNVHMSLKDLWSIIGAKPYLNIRDLYENGFMQAIHGNLKDKDGLPIFPEGVKNEGDNTPITEADVNMLFVLHGFFGDKNTNQNWDNGEEVGWAGLDGRPNTPLITNAYVKVNVFNLQGEPIDHASVQIDIVFENSYFNYSSEWELPEATDNLIYLELPPPGMRASAEFTVLQNGLTSAKHVIDNAKYWDKVQYATNGYVEELTFVINNKDRSEIGNVLLIILMFSGVALILILAARKKKALR